MKKKSNIKPPIIKFFIGRIANGRWWHRLLFVLVVFVSVFFVTLEIAKITVDQDVSMNKILIDMLSVSSLAENVKNHTGDNSVGLGLLFIYVTGLVFFSGFLIASITTWVQSFAKKFNAGKLNYPNLRNHILILGYDEMLVGMLNSMKQNGVFDRHRVVIALQDDVEVFRQTTASKFSSNYREQLILFQVNLTDGFEMEKKLKVHKAVKVYIIGNSDMEAHDSLNLSSFVNICSIAERKGNMPHCYVNFQHQSSIALFQTYSSAHSKTGISNKTQDIHLYEKYKQFFHPFNFDELWARKVLLNIDGRYDGLEIDCRETWDENTGTFVRKSISEIEDGFVHIVIYEMSELAEAFAKEISFLSHYPNYIKNPSVRTRITIVDEDLESKMHYFVGRYSEFFKHCHHRLVKYSDEIKTYERVIAAENDFLDIEFEFIEANNSDTRFVSCLREWCEDEKQYVTFIMCYENTIRNNAAGLYMPRFVYEKGVPIFIHQRNKGCLGEFLAESMFAKVCPFGMYDDYIDIDESIELEWAKRLNYFCYSGYKTGYSNRKDIEDQWNKTRISARWSSIYNAASIPVKYRCIGIKFVYGVKMPAFTHAQLELLSRVEHNRWNVEKLLMGYRPATKEERENIEKDLLKGSVELRERYKMQFVNRYIVPYDEMGFDEKGRGINECDKMVCAEYSNILNAVSV